MNPTSDALLKRSRRKQRIALISVISNTFLTISKLVVGLMIGSVSVISEAIHSGVDLIAAVIAWTAVRHADKPADSDHPYGHGKLENVSGGIEALLIFVAAGWILVEAVKKLMHPESLDEVGPGLVIMGVSALVNLLVSQKLFQVGRETDSQALLADAWHLRTDVWTSAGIMLGLAGIWAGERFWPTNNWHWIDPVAAILVAVLIIKAAWDLSRDAYHALMDSTLPEDEITLIRAIIQELRQPIASVHDLRTRKSGSHRFVEFHLTLPHGMSVKESHAITEEIERRIHERFAGTQITIHVEPCDEDACHRECLAQCRQTDNPQGAS
jgi:cation diffusion facilitator family transporter